MLGNFSFGGYWKKEAIKYAYDFITKTLGLHISYVTIFKGSERSQGRRIQKNLEITWRFRYAGRGDRGRLLGATGTSGPCGPTTEIYCKNAAGKDVEIWNIVFNEFFCSGSREELLAGNARLTPLATKGIDTGMGLERLAMIAQGKKNIFETDLFQPLIGVLPSAIDIKSKRIAADHARAISFLLSDGVRPSNKGAGYILRRLMRRIIVHEYLSKQKFIREILEKTATYYKESYNELDKQVIIDEFEAENAKFQKTLKNGLKELERTDAIDAVSAFKIYESYGLPYEIIKELGGEKAHSLERKTFDEEFKKHQELSRAGAEKKFGGHRAHPRYRRIESGQRR